MKRGRSQPRRWAFVFLAALLCGSASTHPEPRRISPQPADLRSGDIIFIRGTSVRSLGVQLFGGGADAYSHVGLIVIESGTAFVIHAEPTRGGTAENPGAVLKERWDVLLSPDRVRGGAVYRVSDLPVTAADLASEAAERYVDERRSFDHDFDLSSTDKLYCTELVWRAYSTADADMPLRAAGRLPKRLFPSHLLDLMNLREVCRF